MPRRKPHASTAGHLRREIACAAARMMAEDGIGDYGFAKRKAAKSLGVGDGETLPTNEEVETELRAYQALYQDDEQPLRLRELRQVALSLMEHLADFHPYLTGALVDGTAGRYAGIEIDVFADSAKDVEIMLLSTGISYQPDDKIQNRPDSPEARVSFDWHGVPARLSIYPFVAERRKARNPLTGRTPPRARIDAVATLLKETATGQNGSICGKL